MFRIISAILMIGSIAASGGVSAASATYPGNGAYTFTGSVVSAKGSCPYATNFKVAGYTLFRGTESVYPYNGRQLQIKGGLHLVISPGGAAAKTDVLLKNVIILAGIASPTATGSANVYDLKSTNEVAASYKFVPTFATATAFTAKLVLNIGSGSSGCAATYNLAFAKGLPANLFNLL